MKNWNSLSSLYITLLLILFPPITFAEGMGTSSTSIEETTYQTETSSGNRGEKTPDLSAEVKKGSRLKQYGLDLVKK